MISTLRPLSSEGGAIPYFLSEPLFHSDYRVPATARKVSSRLAKGFRQSPSFLPLTLSSTVFLLPQSGETASRTFRFTWLASFRHLTIFFFPRRIPPLLYYRLFRGGFYEGAASGIGAPQMIGVASLPGFPAQAFAGGYGAKKRSGRLEFALGEEALPLSSSGNFFCSPTVPTFFRLAVKEVFSSLSDWKILFFDRVPFAQTATASSASTF